MPQQVAPQVAEPQTVSQLLAKVVSQILEQAVSQALAQVVSQMLASDHSQTLQLPSLQELWSREQPLLQAMK